MYEHAHIKDESGVISNGDLHAKNVEPRQNAEIKQNIKSGGERNETGLDEFLNALNITRKYALSTCPKKIPSILRRSKRVKGVN